MPTEPIRRLTDENLVLLSLLGDLTAYDELVRRYRGAVWAVADQICPDSQRAEDATQDAFLSAFKALPQLQNPAKFGSWVFAIVRHRARQIVRLESRCQAREDEEIDQLILNRSVEIAPHPAEALIRKIERLSVRQALGRLPEEQRIVLRLYYYEEWPVKKIAEFLSLPVTTIKWRLHQGRQWLKSRLGDLEEKR